MYYSELILEKNTQIAICYLFGATSHLTKPTSVADARCSKGVF